MEQVGECAPSGEPGQRLLLIGRCWPLVGCVQRAESHCCFNSKLARIVQEQGRAQIPSMGGFGTAREPNCRGFRPEEFQAIDFSKIDLSEYFDELQTRSQALIEGEIRTRVEARF